MRKLQIIDEAFKLFARQGYGSTTMQQIGDAVGLDKSSLYVHFKNKSDIFTVILDKELQSYNHGVMDTALESGNFKEVSHSILINTLKYFSDKDKLLFWKHVMLMPNNGTFVEIAEQTTNALYQLNTSFSEKLWAIISHTDDPLQKHRMSLCLFIMAQGLMDWLVLRDKVEPKDIDDAMYICSNILNTAKLFN